jgi:hypothetical protein
MEGLRLVRCCGIFLRRGCDWSEAIRSRASSVIRYNPSRVAFLLPDGHPLRGSALCRTVRTYESVNDSTILPSFLPLLVWHRRSYSSEPFYSSKASYSSEPSYSSKPPTIRNLLQFGALLQFEGLLQFKTSYSSKSPTIRSRPRVRMLY